MPQRKRPKVVKPLGGLPYKLVAIEWVDSSCLGRLGWTHFDDLADLPEEVHRCVSVGFLVRVTKTMKILVPHVADVADANNHQAYGAMKIPRSAIVAERVLA